MFRVALKSILGRKTRLLLTSIAVVVGTAFLGGTSIFSATLDRTFNNLFQDVFANIDGYVRSTDVVEGDFGLIERQRIEATLVDKVKAVPGVSDAVPDIQAFARIIGKDGKPIGTEGAGPPTFGSVAVEFKGQLWTIPQGRYPNGPTEVALDEASAEKAGYVLGDTVKVVAQAGSRTFTLVGIASYGDVRSPGGATFALFDVETAAEFLGKPGYVDAILVTGDGSRSDKELAADIDKIFNPSQKIETLTGAEITKETQDDIGQFVSIFSTFLSIFSFIALGVGSFVIYNVFSISAAQRKRENSLLRALGAGRSQITRMLLAESVVVGIAGSLLGFVGGIGISRLLQVLLPALGFEIPAGGLVIQSSAFINTVIIGLIVTVLSAIVPARRAGKVPPLAAMRESALESVGPRRARLIGGLIVMALGVAVVGAVVGGASNNYLGIGILLVFISTIVLGPVIARPVALFIGRPVAKIRGVSGAMARQNSARNPLRTARTAAPVMIGVALVTAVTALAASITGQIEDIFTEQFKGDYAVNTEAQGFGGLSPSLASDLSKIDGVKSASGIGTILAKQDGKGRTLTVITPSTIEGTFDIGLADAQYKDLDTNGIFVSEKTAERESLKKGSTVSFTLADGVERTLTVRGIYANDDLAGGRVINRELFAGTTVSSFDIGVFITIDQGANTEEVRSSLEKSVQDYGQGTLLSRSEYIDKQAGSVNQLLGVIYALLFLSVFIAIIGIIITLLLSVFERKRETGLLRAVGMTKSQVRTVVRWESVITSLLGVVLGIVLGMLLGWVIVFALRDQGLTTFTIPVTSTIVIVIVSFLVGLFAAIYPAWRATKVDVLEALNTN
jgi:putative ABC transport system permease protein